MAENVTNIAAHVLFGLTVQVLTEEAARQRRTSSHVGCGAAHDTRGLTHWPDTTPVHISQEEFRGKQAKRQAP